MRELQNVLNIKTQLYGIVRHDRVVVSDDAVASVGNRFSGVLVEWRTGRLTEVAEPQQYVHIRYCIAWAHSVTRRCLYARKSFGNDGAGRSKNEPLETCQGIDVLRPIMSVRLL